MTNIVGGQGWFFFPFHLNSDRCLKREGLKQCVSTLVTGLIPDKSPVENRNGFQLQDNNLIDF